VNLEDGHRVVNPQGELKMDKTLAEFYGTNADVEADAEKLAAAEAAEVLAAEKGVNLEEMTEEDLEAVAEQVLKGEGGETPTAETPVEEPEKAAQEKFAEADYMGRVMAHAFVNESKEIEKEAAAKEKTAKGFPTGRMGVAAMAAGQKAHELGSAAKKGAGKVGEFVKKHGKKFSAGAGAAGGAAAAHAAHKAKEKKSSAIDQLVETRALEILEASGIDPSKLEKVSSAEETTVDPKQVLAETVENRAWELLKEYGVEPAPAEAATE
jgi:hypothetical protein